MLYLVFIPTIVVYEYAMCGSRNISGKGWGLSWNFPEKGGGAIECDSLKNAQTKLFLHKKYFKEKNSNRKSASNISSLQIKYNFKM